MGVYSNTQIRQAIDDGHIVCHPFNQKHVAHASLDVTLGHYYYRIERMNERTIYNPFDKEDVERYFDGPHKAMPHGEWCALNGFKPFNNIPLDHPVISLKPRERILAVFDSNGVLAGLPVPVAFAVRAALMGFFAGLAAAALHVAGAVDPVEALYRRTAPGLSGELARLAHGAFDLYQRAREALASSPQSAARQHVGRSLEAVTARVLDLAGRWHALDVEVGDGAERGVAQRVAEVQKLRLATGDPSARTQLQAAERALNDELAQIRRIRAGRERVLARLHADLATLERTRFSLLALRCTDAHLAASELSQLSEDLGALGAEMDGEARAVDEALRATAAVAPRAAERA